MAKYQITWKAVTHEVIVQPTATALPTGFTKIGEFDHDDAADVLGPDVNHVIWHHVRDALYYQGQLDMQVVTINLVQ
jgi:hypothetical protein